MFKLTIIETIPEPRGITESEILSVLGGYIPGAQLIIRTPGCDQIWEIVTDEEENVNG